MSFAAPLMLGTSVLGGGISAMGQFAQGQSQAALYNYQTGVARINEQIDKQNAEYERVAGEREAGISGMQSRARTGQIIATQGASNLDVNRGSQLQVQQSSHELGVQDQSTIRANAARKAFGYETQAVTDEAQSRLFEASAKTAKTAGILGGIGSLIGTAGQVSSQWLWGQQLGAF